MSMYFNKVFVVEAFPEDMPSARHMLFWKATPDVAEAALMLYLESKDDYYKNIMCFNIVEVSPDPDRYCKLIKRVDPACRNDEVACYTEYKNG